MAAHVQLAWAVESANPKAEVATVAPKPAVSGSFDDTLLATALAVRIAGIDNPAAIYSLLSISTATGTFQNPVPLLGWSLFFRGSFIKIGRLRANQPVLVFYNPFLDVALVSRWQPIHGRRFEVAEAGVIPGEMLDPGAQVTPESLPLWVRAEKPFSVLRDYTILRLGQLSAIFPIQSSDDHTLHLADPNTNSHNIAIMRLLRNAGAVMGISDRSQAAFRTVDEATIKPKEQCAATLRRSTSKRLVWLCGVSQRFRSSLGIESVLEISPSRHIIMATSIQHPDVPVLYELSGEDPQAFIDARALQLRVAVAGGR